MKQQCSHGAGSWLLLRGGAEQCEYFYGTKIPTQVEDGNFRLSTSTWAPDGLEPEG